jgi:hypothetical protein
VLFVAVAVAAAVLAGLRWARAYERYRVFRRADIAGLLAPEPAAAVSAAAPAGPAVKQPRAVAFHLDAPDAKAVLLGGSFNDFDAGETPMTRRLDGTWEAVLTLPPGRYFYKFKVDGRWTLDPSNPERTGGAHEASVLDLQ